MQSTLTTGQLNVLSTLRQFGQATDPALATYIHHMSDNDMSSSGVRTRRSELVRKGYVEAVGVKRMKSGRSSAIWALTPLGRIEAGKLFGIAAGTVTTAKLAGGSITTRGLTA